MPIYEYKCPSCTNVFEQMQSFQSEPVFPCPKCGTEAKRLISVSGFVLKGAGFYVNDYKPGKPDESGKVSASRESSDNTSSRLTESKPSTSSESSSKTQEKSAEGKSDIPSSSGGKSEKSSTSADAPKSGSVA